MRGIFPRFDNATIALAFELANDGIPWKVIDHYLGDGVARAANSARRRGMFKKLPVYQQPQKSPHSAGYTG